MVVIVSSSIKSRQYFRKDRNSGRSVNALDRSLGRRHPSYLQYQRSQGPWLKFDPPTKHLYQYRESQIQQYYINLSKALTGAPSQRITAFKKNVSATTLPKRYLQ